MYQQPNQNTDARAARRLARDDDKNKRELEEQVSSSAKRRRTDNVSPQAQQYAQPMDVDAGPQANLQPQALQPQFDAVAQANPAVANVGVQGNPALEAEAENWHVVPFQQQPNQQQEPAVGLPHPPGMQVVQYQQPNQQPEPAIVLPHLPGMQVVPLDGCGVFGAMPVRRNFNLLAIEDNNGHNNPNNNPGDNNPNNNNPGDNPGDNNPNNNNLYKIGVIGAAVSTTVGLLLNYFNKKNKGPSKKQQPSICPQTSFFEQEINNPKTLEKRLIEIASSYCINDEDVLDSLYNHKNCDKACSKTVEPIIKTIQKQNKNKPRNIS